MFSLSRFLKWESKKWGQEVLESFYWQPKLVGQASYPFTFLLSLHLSCRALSLSPLSFSNFNLKSLHSHDSRLLISALHYSLQSIQWPRFRKSKMLFIFLSLSFSLVFSFWPFLFVYSFISLHYSYHLLYLSLVGAYNYPTIKTTNYNIGATLGCSKGSRINPEARSYT